MCTRVHSERIRWVQVLACLALSQTVSLVRAEDGLASIPGGTSIAGDSIPTFGPPADQTPWNFAQLDTLPTEVRYIDDNEDGFYEALGLVVNLPFGAAGEYDMMAQLLMPDDATPSGERLLGYGRHRGDIRTLYSLIPPLGFSVDSPGPTEVEIWFDGEEIRQRGAGQSTEAAYLTLGVSGIDAEGRYVTSAGSYVLPVELGRVERFGWRSVRILSVAWSPAEGLESEVRVALEVAMKTRLSLYAFANQGEDELARAVLDTTLAPGRFKMDLQWDPETISRNPEPGRPVSVTVCLYSEENPDDCWREPPS